MRLNCHSVSILVALAGCILFPFGGFMLVPVALDLWEHGSRKQPVP